MREFIAGVMGCVLTTGLLLGCASGPTQEELAAKVEAERQEAVRKRVEEEQKRAETARKEAELKAALAKVSALEQAGQAAEGAGKLREAFKQYLAALEAMGEMQSPDTDLRLREQIIKTALRLDPPPVVPPEAERHMVWGQTAVKQVQSMVEYNLALSQFGKAVHLAPWWAEAYFNLAVVQEKAGLDEQAIRHLKLYLLAAPNAKDQPEVQRKIYELDFSKEMKRKQLQEWVGTWTLSGVAFHSRCWRSDPPEVRTAAIDVVITVGAVADTGEVPVETYDFESGRIQWTAKVSSTQLTAATPIPNLVRVDGRWRNTFGPGKIAVVREGGAFAATYSLSTSSTRTWPFGPPSQCQFTYAYTGPIMRTLQERHK